jgi:hypothetical protein
MLLPVRAGDFGSEHRAAEGLPSLERRNEGHAPNLATSNDTRRMAKINRIAKKNREFALCGHAVKGFCLHFRPEGPILSAQAKGLGMVGD